MGIIAITVGKGKKSDEPIILYNPLTGNSLRYWPGHLEETGGEDGEGLLVAVTENFGGQNHNTRHGFNTEVDMMKFIKVWTRLNGGVKLRLNTVSSAETLRRSSDGIPGDIFSKMVEAMLGKPPEDEPEDQATKVPEVEPEDQDSGKE